ncbi:MAG: hypothetical protein GX958_07675 [Desulfitobacterium sp.]|nr:hypothetical protein [Desulfitobacterium sp.]
MIFAFLSGNYYFGVLSKGVLCIGALAQRTYGFWPMAQSILEFGTYLRVL